MTDTTSLELSKQLFKLLPDAKTEYVWGCLGDADFVSTIDECEERGYGVMCPAWQIHELLEILPLIYADEEIEGILRIIRDLMGYIVCYWCPSIDEPLYGSSILDMSLVEALGKLMLWLAKQKEGKP